MQVSREFAGEKGFAVGVVDESDVSRMLVKVLPKGEAKQTTAGNEAAAQPTSRIEPDPSPLFSREQFFQRGKGFTLQIQIQNPDMQDRLVHRRQAA
ncbi:MAG: hypothetical protein OXJ55_00035 [Caldilineaceae bacterium]|nr:hypothetical protein [Caldilineaceae bacterium]